MAIKIDREKFIRLCNESESMAKAAVQLGLHFNTFKRYALKFDCYNTNQSGKGIKKNVESKIHLLDILEGKYPEYQTFKLKNRLIKEGYLNNICSECGIKSWNDKPLNMELDHIDGNRSNHILVNLRMLCPNCHAQTNTHRAKNIKNLSATQETE